MAGKKQSLTPEEKLSQALLPREEWPYELPKGWVWTRIETCVKVSKEKTDDFRNPLLKYVGLENFESNKGIISFSSASNVKSTKNVFHSGQILYGKLRPYLNKHDIVDFEGICSTDILVIDTLNICIPSYFNSYLDLDQFIAYAIQNSKGINLPRVNENTIMQVAFPLPPLPEQQRIVARIESLFAKLDAARDKLQQVLDTQEARRAAILHKAFTGQLTGHKGSAECRGKREEEGLQNPEGTEFVPEGWKNIELKDCIQLLSGQDFPRNKYNDENEGIPYITGASNFLNNHVIINRWTSTPTVIAKENDILLVCKGSGYGKVCIADFQEAHIARQIMALRPNAFINNRFLYYYLQNMYKTLRNQGQGLIPGISRKVVLNLNITLPPLDEQQKIVQFLDRFDRQNDKVNTLIQQSLSQIDLLKKSILARAFRGQLGTQDPSDPDARDLLTSE
ncbi:restriction endonuclease subunit S [Acidaminococcus timonensis]|uniref:restriction endonuclease subunit S n=1 Tax=Acidaminococcus timonensis TaxID=1871002 RepID=UPI003078E120